VILKGLQSGMMKRNQIFSLVGAVIIVLIVFLIVVGDYLPNVSETRSVERVPSELKFAALGDWGCSFQTINNVKGMLEKDVELVLGLGDFSYTNSADCFFDIVESIDDKIKIVFGNHDTYHSSVLDQIQSHYNQTNQYYSFDYERIHFTVISTELPMEVGTEQYLFISKDLSEASSDPDVDWIVILLHHPAYISKSEKVSATKDEIKHTLHPMFDFYGVDLVLQAHVHNYQRSFPLKYNEGSPSKPIVTDHSPNHYTNPEGQVYVIVGTGGHSLHNFTEYSPYMASHHLGYGFLYLESVTGEVNSISGTFYDTEGSIHDQFTINKFPKGAKYKYQPNLKLDGSNFEELKRNDLQLSNFSVAFWFRTDEGYIPETTAYLVNKGGTGVDIPGNNMNYGIWMDDNGLLRTGFETLRGVGTNALSSFANNDGKWHYVVSTFDGEMLRLYVDGSQVARKLGQGFPDDTGNQPLRVGANSLRLDGFFEGEIDEVRVWDRGLTTEEIEDQYSNGIFDTNGQLVHLPFE